MNLAPLALTSHSQNREVLILVSHCIGPPYEVSFATSRPFRENNMYKVQKGPGT